jgi:molybdopterin molybdotransferase
VLGLPGNPVSSMVCARIFVVPLIRALLGSPGEGERPRPARAAVPIEANGPRQHYMRATSALGSDGLALVTPVRSQDSSLLAPLAEADCLLVRAPHAPALAAGSPVEILPLDF